MRQEPRLGRRRRSGAERKSMSYISSFCQIASYRSYCLQRAALQNMEKILKAAGSGLEHVLKCNVFLANIQTDFKLMNDVYIEVRSAALT